MCQIAVHYQENLPSESESYKTQHFAVDIREEVASNGNISQTISQMFRIAKANVQAQIMQAKGDSQFSPKQSPPQQLPQNSSSANGKSATDKQIKYIKTLARKKGYSNDAINKLPYDYFGKSYYQLTSREASTIIENLNAKR